MSHQVFDPHLNQQEGGKIKLGLTILRIIILHRKAWESIYGREFLGYLT